MTKLFLQSGKLMIGEFPEEPIPYGVGDEQYYGARMDEYHAAIESAKASAVEVVPDWRAVKFDAENQIWWLLDPTQGIYDEMKEGQLYDIPSGWKVEYEDVPLKLYKQKVVEKIARLIPTSESAQGAHYGDACGICGGPCVVGSKGLYCPKCQPNKALNEVGIVATGIPEAEQHEALAFLNEDDWTVPESGAPTYAARLACTRWLSQCLEFGWRKDQLDGLEKIWWQHHDRNGVLVKPDKAVSPPSQAERESQEELWKETINLYSKRDHSADGRADMMKEFTITRKTKP